MKRCSKHSTARVGEEVKYVILHERGTSCGSILESMGLPDKADFNRIIIAAL